MNLCRLLLLTLALGLGAAVAHAGCSSPTAAAGQMTYATNYNSMAYCDGSNWVSMAGGVSVTVGGTTNNYNATAAGSAGYVQYNDGSNGFAASSNFAYSSGLLTLTGTVTATNVYAGNISTTTLWVNGTQITGSANGDRITSGTLLAVANSATGYISLSTAGSTWGYLGSAVNYLPTLKTNTLSATTAIQVGSNSLTCATDLSGTLRYSSISSTMEYCNGTAWTSMGPSATSVPAFSVNKGGTNQTVTNAAWTKLTWPNEVFDTNNNFASDKFTPTIAGKYVVTLSVRCQDSTSYCTPAIYKNGSEVLEGNYVGGVNTAQTQNVMGVVDMNGTTDYLEAYIINGGGTLIMGTAPLTYFTGTLIASGNGLAGSGGSTSPGGNNTNIQYNSGGGFAGSDNFAWVNGSNTVSVTGTVSATYGYFKYISATSGLGAGTLASLTDVSASAPSSGMLLRYNGSKWESVGASTALSTTTMVPNWPDAILCSSGSDSYALYIVGPSGGGGYVYRYIQNNASDAYIIYTGAGAYSSNISLSSLDCVTGTYSISQLYALGKAFNFIGNNGVSTSSTALGDRITSGTLAATANSATGYISLTTGGTTWGYLSSGNNYLPNLGTGAISATVISATAIQLVSQSTGPVTCNSGNSGSIRYNSPTTTLELCTGSGWVPMGVGIPAGTISAFASSTCPTGWSEYTAARGRFLRGIDNGAGVDPSGTRTPGGTQEDTLKSHIHTIPTYGNGSAVAAAGSSLAGVLDGPQNAHNYITDAAGSTETRPVNVAVTFCQFNGTSNGWNNPLSGGGTSPGGNNTYVQYNSGGSFGGDSNFTYSSGLLTLTGTVTATNIYAGNISTTTLWVNGTQITGSSSGDRIVSGTTSVVANSATSIISITTAGVTTGYFDSVGRLVVPGISVTQNYGVSSTTGYFSGLVGIGTASPGSGGGSEIKLDVSSTGHVALRLNAASSSDAWTYFSQNNTMVGAVGYRNSTGGLTLYESGGDRVILKNGSLGIGISSPNTSLTVIGEVQVSNSNVTCSASTAGAIRYQSGSLKYCNGSAFTTLSSGGTPGGVSGSIQFNSNGSFGGRSDIVVDASGKVGIGAATPTNPLTVVGSTAQIRLNNSTNNVGGYIFSMADPNLNLSAGGDYNAGWVARSSNVASISSGGNNWSFYIDTGLTPGNNFSPTMRMYLNTTGLGIGTTVQAYQLDVVSNSTTGYSAIRAYNQGASGNSQAALLAQNGVGVVNLMEALGSLGYIGTSSNNSLAILTSNTERMRINTSGNVGIGTTNPSKTLTVMSNASDAQQVLLGNAGQNGFLWALGREGASTGRFSIYQTQNGSTYTEPFTILTSGNVGIGMPNPIYPLQVSGTGIGIASISPTLFLTESDSGGNLFQVTVDSNTLSMGRWNYPNSLNVTGTGNVGIGTASPNYKLEVAGNFAVTGLGNATGYYTVCYDWNGSSGTRQLFWAGSCTVSDARLKRDVHELADRRGLEAIIKLHPVSFRWREPGYDEKAGPQIGFIAQDVEKVFPEVVENTGADKAITLGNGKTETIKGVKNVKYEALVVPLVKAVQELKADNDNLRGELKSLKADNDNIRQEMRELRSAIQRSGRSR